MAVESTMIPLGTEAPAFTLPDPSGRMHSLDDIVGEHGTLVAFLCNHCPYVQHIATVLGDAADRWVAGGLGVVGINSNDAEAYPDDAPDAMAERADEWGWHFPYLVDAEQTVGRAYTAACTPDFFLFDRDRRLVYRGRFDGARPKNDEPVTGDDLDAAVAALVAGEPVTDDQWPSMGCSIKWRTP
jgi:peroxiredoxin